VIRQEQKKKKEGKQEAGRGGGAGWIAAAAMWLKPVGRQHRRDHYIISQFPRSPPLSGAGGGGGMRAFCGDGGEG